MDKPKIWDRNGRLTKKAKQYISFKLREHWKARKERELIDDFPIRVWAKFSYPDSTKRTLFIEAFVDGMFSQEAELQDLLIKAITKAFNDGIADLCQLGSEKIDRTTGQMEIRYKASKKSRWKYMR